MVPDLFNEGRTWFISSKNIYVALEGVAATVDLTPDQAEWYLLSDEAVPHVSLSLHPEHHAKELRGVVKLSLAAGDWQDTSVTNLSLVTEFSKQVPEKPTEGPQPTTSEAEWVLLQVIKRQ
ncbi:hypothetical protein GOODEAATRI_034334 [Goodea atripinnis]|uniref:Uncharacterized protein n=1 Tax=Goodea atripinnis TaxID=208336 RepID=A0ABV0N6I2_9TELE